jgi:hypothetical protein
VRPSFASQNPPSPSDDAFQVQLLRRIAVAGDVVCPVIRAGVWVASMV